MASMPGASGCESTRSPRGRRGGEPDAAPGLKGPRQSLVRRLDAREALRDRRRHGRASPRVPAHVQGHQLVGRDQVAVHGVEHLVEVMDALHVVIEQPGSESEGISFSSFAMIRHVGLEAERGHAMGVPVRLVEPDVTEPLVGCEVEHDEVVAHVHVMVVIDPLGPDHVPIDVERRLHPGLASRGAHGGAQYSAAASRSLGCAILTRSKSPFRGASMLYELRRYDVAAGKLPALVDRFGSFTVHKWKEYGFRLVGFWTPMMGEKSNQIVYIWAWDSYEERTKKNAAWRADPERAKKWAETQKDGPLVNRVYNQLMEPTSYSQLDNGQSYGPDASTRTPYFFELREYQAMPQKIVNITDRFGNFTCEAFKKHGFRQVGYWLNRIGGNDHQLTYMLAWESLDERVSKFDTFLKDPERIRVFAESEKNGPIVEQVTVTILRPTAFSPMK